MTAIEQVIQKAIAFDHGDAQRIHHFLKVYAYADTIGRLEGLPEGNYLVTFRDAMGVLTTRQLTIKR